MTFDEFCEVVYPQLLGSTRRKKATAETLWRQGYLTSSDVVSSQKLHVIYERNTYYEIAEFVRDVDAFEKRKGRPGSTNEIRSYVNGKKSTDGACYGTMLGLLSRFRAKGEYVYSLTKTGKAFLSGRRKMPDTFLIFNKALIAVSRETVSFQESFSSERKPKRGTFRSKKADRYVAHLPKS